METTYKEQLIVENNGKVTFFLYDEDGDISSFAANSTEHAKKRIDAYESIQGGLFNADGEILNS